MNRKRLTTSTSLIVIVAATLILEILGREVLRVLVVCVVRVVCCVEVNSNTYTDRQTQHARITLVYCLRELDIYKEQHQ